MSLPPFERLGLPSELVTALAARHISEPFAIQASTLPDALAGRDILGRAPTGSGKTLAFGLPALARLAAAERAASRQPRALILSPTRELAEQIQRELRPLARAVGRRVAAVYGGAAIGRQIAALARGVDLLVATPGRLLDLIEQGEVVLDRVELAVVDEADRMADMGFLPDVRRLLDRTAPDRQTLLFSATLDDDVRELTDRYQRDPALHEIGEPEPDLALMEHRFIKVKKLNRLGVAADLIAGAGGPTIVFVRTRHGVDRLARQLRQHGVKAGHLHGGRTQSQRARALELFVDGKVDALVATDVAARGLHVDGVACVLHYDPPAETKDYVHRSGRTARAGTGGTVISLLDPVQVETSQRMQRKLGIEAEIEAPPRRRPRPERSTLGNGSDAEPRAATRTEPKAATRTRPKPATKAKPKAKRAANTKAKPRAATRAKPAAETKARPKPATKAKPKAKRAAEAKPKAKTKAKVGRSGGPRASKRTGRPRPPNRKGKLTGRRRRSGDPRR